MSTQDVVKGFSTKDATGSTVRPLFSIMSLDCCRIGSKADILPADIPGTILVLSCRAGQAALDQSHNSGVSPYTRMLVKKLAQAQRKDFRALMQELVREFPLIENQWPEMISNITTVVEVDPARDARLQDNAVALRDHLWDRSPDDTAIPAPLEADVAETPGNHWRGTHVPSNQVMLAFRIFCAMSILQPCKASSAAVCVLQKMCWCCECAHLT